MSGFDLDRYLARLHLHPRDVPATAEGMARLQAAQIRHIPFETLDPFLGVEPGVTSAAVSDKILQRGRGGYCFELNRLFHDALSALGFDVTRRLARVRKGAPQGGARTHLLLVCRIDGTDYLADAGFGGPTPLDPITVQEDVVQKVANGAYVLRRDHATGERVLTLRGADGDYALYGFDDAHVTDSDLTAGNFLCCTWSGAPFTRHLMVKGYDGDTALGLLDRQVNETGEKRDLIGAKDLHHLLCGRLGLVLDDATVTAAWARISTLASAP